MAERSLSYGQPDEPFAISLNSALKANGVQTFFFKDDASPGERLHRMMRKGVNEHDRVVLICSKASLVRKGVLNEIEETLAREARNGGETYLIPVRIDDFVFDNDSWASTRDDIRTAIRDRVVADFREATGDDASSRAEFVRQTDRLLRALRKPSGAVTPPRGS